jgi:type II secretory pathway pseudopilin PulG
MIVVAVIAILAAIAIPLYGSLTSQARVAKARGDLRAIASAVSMYQAHAGTLPASIAQLTSAVTNAQGVSAGPFIASVPSPPPGGSPSWTAYETGYATTAEGQFSVSASGDGVSVTVP